MEWCVDEGTDIDIGFHRELIEASESARLAEMMSLCNLQVRSLLLTKNCPLTYEDREQFTHEHLAIVEALKKRDPDLTEKLAREHMREAKERFLRFVEQTE